MCHPLVVACALLQAEKMAVGIKFSLIPKKNRRLIYEYLFKGKIRSVRMPCEKWRAWVAREFVSAVLCWGDRSGDSRVFRGLVRCSSIFFLIGGVGEVCCGVFEIVAHTAKGLACCTSVARRFAYGILLRSALPRGIDRFSGCLVEGTPCALQRGGLALLCPDVFV